VKEVIDQIGRRIYVPIEVNKIVCLVPSITEYLVSIGLEDRLVGITKFCVHPEHLRKDKYVVGGTKKIKLEIIDTLNPDLIIASKEENTKDEVEHLMSKYNVWVSDIKQIEDAYFMMKQIGVMCDCEDVSKSIISSLRKQFQSQDLNLIPVAYLIWKQPYLSIGGDTFINQMLSIAGFKNVFEDYDRYPEITLDQIKERGAKYVFLSSEPYPFSDKHKNEIIEAGLVPILVDGELFSWYGSRLLETSRYFDELRNQL